MKIFALLFILCSLTVWASTRGVVKSDQLIKIDEPAKAKWTEKRVQTGESLISIMRSEGFSKKNTQKLLNHYPKFKHHKLIAKDAYALSKEPQRVRLKFYDADKDNFYIFSLIDGFATLNVETSAFRTELVQVSGEVTGSLFASLAKHIKGYQVPYRFRDAYIHDYNLNKVLRKGAKYSLTYEKKFDGDRFIRTGEVVKSSLEIKGKTVNRHFVFSPDGGGSFVGDTYSKKKPLYSPTNYQKVSSVFQRRRFHPIRKKRIAHLGVDFAIGWGEPVYAAGDGQIKKRTRQRAMGNFIMIEHNKNLITYYSHLSRFAGGFEKGSLVKAGDLIGFIGCTGYCTSPHLHFAVKRRGVFVDPLKYTKTYSKKLAPLIEVDGARLVSSLRD